MQLARLAFLTAALSLVLAPSALASHSFTDVPDGAPFHDEIGIFKATNITTGCTATMFCPQEFVRRQAMAAFIDRALGLLVRPGETTQKGIPGSRVQFLDDDVSFVGTNGSLGLDLRNGGFRVLRLVGGDLPNVIGGAAVNTVTGAVGATVAGGGGGAEPNRVTGDFGTVGGGIDNLAGGLYATVAGGVNNDATDSAASIGGGQNNTAAGVRASIGGGYQNTAAGNYASVVGGGRNTASGDYSFVAGGYNNTASGAYSFAAGRRAQADHDGSFVWADSQDFDFSTIAANTFRVRATGGVRFISGINGTTGQSTAGVILDPGGGSWSSVSDRRLKRDFARVDGERLLRRLAGVPVTTWGYKAQPRSVRHIGPMARDFARAFGVGTDRTHIATVDADGVALAGIQALYKRVQALERENTVLRRQNTRLARVERTVAKLSRTSK